MGLRLADDVLTRGFERIQREVDIGFDALLPVPDDARARLVEAMRYAAGLGITTHLDEGGFPAVFGDHMNRLLSTLFVHVCNDQFRPFPYKCQGCGSPDP